MKIKKIMFTVLTLMLSMSMTATSFAATKKVATPDKPAINFVSRGDEGEIELRWSKIKNNVTGYEVYAKEDGGSWYLEERTGKGTSSVVFSTTAEDGYQVKVRAINKGKETRYYNKKTRKYVSKKTYNRLPKKNRSIKTKVVTKKGAFSDIAIIPATTTVAPIDKVKNVHMRFDENEDVSLSWNYVDEADKYEVSRARFNEDYKTIGFTTDISYLDKYYDPTKAVQYRIRAVKGSRVGEWSEFVYKDPRDIPVRITKKVPKMVCALCKEDVTGKTNTWLKEYHSIYSCSKCGSEIQTHDFEEICAHIKNNHWLNPGFDAKEVEFVSTKEDGITEITTKHWHKWNMSPKTDGTAKVSCECGAVRIVK